MALGNWLTKIIRKKKLLGASLADFKGLRKELKTKDRQSLEKELFKLKIAYNINQEVLSGFGLEEALDILVDRISQFMAVEIVSLMLVAKNKSELVMKFAKGLDKEIVRKAKVRVGEGVSGWVAQNGQPLLIKDISKDLRFSKRNGKYSTDSLLSVPLKIQDKVIGVVNVNNKKAGGIFDEEDLDNLKTIADLSAVAVANSSLQEDAQELDRLRSEFIANVSHELKTPLAALKESVSLILDEIAGAVTDKQRRLLELARKNIERLGRLIDDLLDFSKAESKARSMHRSLFDIEEIITSAVATLEPLANQKAISIKSFLPNKNTEIWGDEDKIHEVMVNFLDNSIKYNKAKGKIEVRLEDVGNDVRLTVADTGVGMSQGNLESIFDRFKRVGNYSDGKIKGSGLGLSIVKEIVEMHGGDMNVESKEDKGTKFTITLPKNLRLRR